MNTPQTTCEQCRFFEPHNEDYGLCRRYAPRPRTDNGEAEAVWPRVSADDACGDGAKREEQR